MGVSTIEIDGSTLQGGGGNSWLGSGIYVSMYIGDIVTLKVSDRSIAGGLQGSGSGTGNGNAITVIVGNGLSRQPLEIDLKDTTLSASKASYEDSIIHGRENYIVPLTASGTITVTDGTLKTASITPGVEGVCIIAESDGVAAVGSNGLTVASKGTVERDGQTTYYPAAGALANAAPGSTVTIQALEDGETLDGVPAGVNLEPALGTIVSPWRV